MYSKETVTNIIKLLAQMAWHIQPSDAEIDAVPTEFHSVIMAACEAGKFVDKMRNAINNN